MNPVQKKKRRKEKKKKERRRSRRRRRGRRREAERYRRSLGKDRSISHGEGVKIERFGEWPVARDQRRKQEQIDEVRRDCGIVREICSSFRLQLAFIPFRFVQATTNRGMINTK